MKPLFFVLASVLMLVASVFIIGAVCAGEAGVYENRWKIEDVQKKYEEEFLKQQAGKNAAALTKTIDRYGMIWGVTDPFHFVQPKQAYTGTIGNPVKFDLPLAGTSASQLALIPVKMGFTKVKVSVGPLVSSMKRTLPRSTVSVQRIVDEEKTTPIPQTGLSMQVGDVPTFLVQASIADKAKPGVYSGHIAVTGVDDTGKSFEMRVPVEVRVRNFLPAPRVSLMRLAGWMDTRVDAASIERNRLAFTLQHLTLPKLEYWRKTNDDGLFITRARKLLDRCKAQATDPAKDTAAFYATMTELADTIERAQFVMKAGLHNATIGQNLLPDHTVLNSSLFTLSTGEIVVQYNVSVYKSDAVTEDSCDWRMVSADNGLSWQPYNGSEKLTQAVKLKSGTLLETWSYGWENHTEADRAALTEKGYYLFDESEGNAKGVISICNRVAMNRSKDAGKTWESRELTFPRFIPDLRPYFMGIAMRDGGYIYPMYGRHDIKAEKEISCLALITHDDGETWDVRLVAPPVSDKFGFNETSMVQAANGDIIAMMRSTPQLELWQATSSDSGKTWSKARYSGIPGSTPYAVRTKDGLLVCITVLREVKLFPERTGVYAGISTDNGKTWKTVCLDDSIKAWTDGYPQAVALPDGRVFAVYTAPREGKSASCGTVFDPRLALGD